MKLQLYGAHLLVAEELGLDSEPDDMSSRALRGDDFIEVVGEGAKDLVLDVLITQFI